MFGVVVRSDFECFVGVVDCMNLVGDVLLGDWGFVGLYCFGIDGVGDYLWGGFG